MQLSIVIVNYNVQYFLEQCLRSVENAIQGMTAEVFVVDNNSVDGSVDLVREKFPWVKLVENKNNVGFSKANNQAIELSAGKYVLLLNPDTVVEESTFKKVVQFMDENPKAGGLGVKMVDGKGTFLPESKRSLPTPEVAFYKIFGFSRLFPNSKTFGKYHLTYLDKDKIHEVEVLSGAFMLLRKEALDKTGLLDEQFFMYGEDIDLSYRIIKEGYKNYYYPDTRIIHYKGESTKKSSVNYVIVFYKAMVIFARKHFTKSNADLLSFIINSAIYFRAGLAILNRLGKQMMLPLLDSTTIFTSLYFLEQYWEHNIKYTDGGTYPYAFTHLMIPAYTLIWLISNYGVGLYSRPYKVSKVFRGAAVGTALILIMYGLLPETLRFSRAIILLGGLTSFLVVFLSRLIFYITGSKRFSIFGEEKKRFLIVGSDKEATRVSSLLNQTAIKPGYIAYADPASTKSSKHPLCVGALDQLHEIVLIYKIDEIIFCAKDVPAHTIISKMGLFYTNKNIDFKIAPPESLFIIGSNSIDAPGELYIVDINSINKSANRRNKRILDISLSAFFLFLFPFFMFTINRPSGFLRNIMSVFSSKKSWVGYCKDVQLQKLRLPGLKPGVLSPVDALDRREKVSTEFSSKINVLYAKDYRVSNDLTIVFKGFKELGRV